MPRKTKYTPDRVEAILLALRDGLTNKDAARAAGIGENTLGDWLNRYRDFRDRVAQAHAERARVWLDGIAAAAPKDWRAYEALLDRCAPDYRKRTQVDQAVTVEVRAAAEKVAADLGLAVDVVLAEAYRLAEDGP